jgi:CheY-like chemotaxis protein
VAEPNLIDTKSQPMVIFYADDDPVDLVFFTRALKRIDSTITCITASDGVEALDKLFSQTNKPDAIFIDLYMPRLDGIECVIAIKRNKDFKRIPIIIISNAINKKEVDQFNRLGVYYFLSKSTFEDLEASLRNIINALSGQ